MTNTIPNVPRTMKKCAACRTEKPVSEMKTCMHNQMHNYVCDSKCMSNFYNPQKRPNQVEKLTAELSAALAKVEELKARVEQLSLPYSKMCEQLWSAQQQRDQQDQRVGELEGLLLEVAASLAWNAHGECRATHEGPIMPSQMALDAVKVALGG